MNGGGCNMKQGCLTQIAL